MTAQTAVLPVAPVPKAPAAAGSGQKKRRVMKTGREDGTGALGAGACFGPPLAQAVAVLPGSV